MVWTPLEKYEFVSWDDDIPNKWNVIKFMFQYMEKLKKVPNHQPISHNNMLTAKNLWSRKIDGQIPWNPHSPNSSPQILICFAILHLSLRKNA